MSEYVSKCCGASWYKTIQWFPQYTEYATPNEVFICDKCNEPCEVIPKPKPGKEEK